MSRRHLARMTQPDALTHPDTLLHMTGKHAGACVGARIPLYGHLRQGASVRQGREGPDDGDAPLSTVLVDLADRVRRLVPSHRDPEAFHEAKSEIEADLRRLARVLPADEVCGRRERMSSLDGVGLSPKVPGLRKG